MPIATGHEHEELEAELEGQKQFDMDAPVGTFGTKGIVSSCIPYYVQGIVMQKRGPVFVTAFSPLMMIIVAIMGSLILSETI